jgi:hypothetical protein
MLAEYLQRDLAAKDTELQAQRNLLVQILQATRQAGALVQNYDDNLLVSDTTDNSSEHWLTA